MNRMVALWGEKAIGAFKYALAVFMVLAGIATTMLPISPLGGDLGFLFAHRLPLLMFGITFVSSGLMLLYGKIKHSRKWTGRGLLFIYLCFLFSGLLNGAAVGFEVVSSWLANLIASFVVGALYLRWRFKTEYVDPKHFVDDVDGMRDDGPPSLKYKE